MSLTKTFWEKTYKENAPTMIGVCYRYVQNKEIAEDLMQDAFLTAINKSETYSGKGSFNGWLRKIAVNTALMYLRNEKSKKHGDDLMLNELEYQNMDEPRARNIKTVVEEAEFSEAELLDVINSLPEHHRLVFNMYVIDNYTHVQIGKELNISVGTSKSHLARARKKIQKLLHQKALERTQEPKKKKRASVFLIFACKSAYFDKLFKRKLGNFSIQPSKNAGVSSSSVHWNKLVIPKVRSTSLKGSKPWIWGLPSAVIVVVIGIYIGHSQKESPIPKLDSATNVELDTLAQPTNVFEPEPISEAANPIKDSSIIEEPVVIKKTIIKRKTITIRDTVTLIDSEYEK